MGCAKFDSEVVRQAECVAPAPAALGRSQQATADHMQLVDEYIEAKQSYMKDVDWHGAKEAGKRLKEKRLAIETSFVGAHHA